MDFLKKLTNKGPLTLLKSRKQWGILVAAFVLNYFEVEKETLAYIVSGMQSLVILLMSVEKNIKVKNGGKK